MEEDRSPTYFLGITSVIMFFSYFLPLTLWCIGAFIDGVGFLFRRLRNPASGPAPTGVKAKENKRCFSASLREKAYLLKAAIRRFPADARNRLNIYWTHPSLLLLQDLPDVLNRIIQPRYVLCTFWLLSLYFFMIQVPKARLLEILELNPHDATITASEIKSAYKKLSFKYHPDHGKTEEHREKYEQVRKAYKRLKAAQKARESGGSEEDYLDDDGERGVSIPIPLFLRQYSVDHPGRTVFVLLIIAFGLPAYLIYHLLFRPRAQKSSARSTGIRSYAEYQQYMKWIAAYKNQIDLLFSGLGNIIEAPADWEKPKETPKSVIRENSPLDCPFQFPEMSGAPSPHDDSVHKTGETESSSVKNEPQLKIYFEAVSPCYMSIVFSYIDIIVNTVIEKIIPIDIQSKNKRLLQLYDDKKALMKRINETAWTNGQKYMEVASPSISKSDEVKKEKVESSSNATIRFLHRTQSRYKIEKDKDSQSAEGGVDRSSPISGELGDDMSGKSVGTPSNLHMEMVDKKVSCPYISIRYLEKLQQIDEEIAQLFADIEKSSFEYLSSYHIRGRKRQEKSKKLKKEKQSARS